MTNKDTSFGDDTTSIPSWVKLVATICLLATTLVVLAQPYLESIDGL